jgi:demethylmenaquinone methyltransferase/2-methoxy-6-polyprenyl-1,4-benzoquinol methylase
VLGGSRSLGLCSRPGLAVSVWRSVVEAIEAVTPRYELVNVAMSLGLGWIARRRGVAALARACPEPRVVVDVGPGPGPSLDLLARGLQPSYLVALEPSEAMASRLPRGHSVDVVVGVAEAMPLRLGCCDAATAFYSARDFMDAWAGVAEMARVSRRCLLLVDMFRPANRLVGLLLRLWVCWIVPVIAMVLAGPVWRSYRMLCTTLEGWCPWQPVARALARRMLVAVWSAGRGSVAAILGVRP